MSRRPKYYSVHTVELGKALTSEEAIALILRRSTHLAHQRIIDIIRAHPFVPVNEGARIDIAVVRQNHELALGYAQRSEVITRAHARKLRNVTVQEAVDLFLQEKYPFTGTVVIGSSPLEIPGRRGKFLLGIRCDTGLGSKPYFQYIDYDPNMVFRIGTMWAFALKKK